MISLPSYDLCYRDICLAHPYMLIGLIISWILLVTLMLIPMMRFSTKEEEKKHRKDRMGIRIFFAVITALILACAFIALSSPYRTEEIVQPGDPRLTVLLDSSISMSVFDQQSISGLLDSLTSRIPLTIKTIAEGTESRIGDGLLASIKGDDNILIITDGNNNAGRRISDVLLFASSLNSTVHTVGLTPVRSDVSVFVDGPSEAIVGDENEFLVEVQTVGSPPSSRLIVEVDGEVVIDETDGKSQNFRKSFAEGYHTILAKVLVDDSFKENNIYHKAVKVLPRPKLLFISEKSSVLFSELQDIYDVTTQNFIPEKMDEYAAVILNDLPGSYLKGHIGNLADYAADGGGLFVIGGKNSYDLGLYNKLEYAIEPLLPVRVGKVETEAENTVNTVLLIDISESGGGVSGWGQETRLDVSKALAVKILSDMRPDDHVAALAFESSAIALTHLQPLLSNPQVFDAIRKLKPTGGTNIYAGLLKAENELMAAKGNKNIIIISDGDTQYADLAVSKAKNLASQGIRTYTVGVGEGRNFKTNFEFMKRLAAAGNGIYFQPSETEYLKILFGREEETENERTSLIILDRDHWITSGSLNLVATISGYNYVSPKVGAKVLVATNQGDPILTVGRFGLGRVVALSTDDGGLWAGSLLGKENSKLLVRAINYAIGNPSRTREFDVAIHEATVGRESEIIVYSDKMPASDSLSFSKVGDRRYSATYVPQSAGFFRILDATGAANYPLEYSRLGVDPDFKSMIELTGGYVFSPDDTDSIVLTIRELTKRIKTSIIYYRWPFMIASIVLFLLSIIVRRLNENKIG